MKEKPQDIDVEAQVLGAILVDEKAIVKVIDTLSKDDFYASSHSRIYSAMCLLHALSTPIDTITLSRQLKSMGALETVGGETYLVELTMRVTSASHVEYHASIVKELSLRRGIIDVSHASIERAYSETEDVQDILGSLQSETFSLSRPFRKGRVYSAKESLDSAVERLETGVQGVTTGLLELDRLLIALENKDLIYLAGRPSTGKTALGLQIAYHAACLRQPVLFFSLEMSKESLVTRLMSTVAHVDSNKIRSGLLSREERGLIDSAREIIAEKPLFIEDVAGASISQIRSSALKMKLDKDIAMIVIDYIQLVSGPSHRNGTKEQEVSAISRVCKAMAKEAEIPVLALSQLSRASEIGGGREPKLSDLRDSGSLEQDADVVLFTHPQPEFHQIIIAKQRNGPVGVVDVNFNKPYTEFTSI